MATTGRPRKTQPKLVTDSTPEDPFAPFRGEDGPIAEDGSIRPVKMGKTAREMVDVFELDGKMYRVPKRINPMLTMRWQREARTVGQYAATENLLLTLLGQDAVDALAESPEVDEEDIAKVFAIVGHLAFGTAQKVQEAVSGN